MSKVKLVLNRGDLKTAVLKCQVIIKRSLEIFSVRNIIFVFFTVTVNMNSVVEAADRYERQEFPSGDCSTSNSKWILCVCRQFVDHVTQAAEVPMSDTT
jgi:hypothetical protein